MSVEENVRTIRLQHDLIASGRLEEAAAQLSDVGRNPGRLVPRRMILAILEDNKTTFPDWSLPIEEIAASGPNMVVRCRFRGTYRGTGKLPINGGLMMGVAPTGRKVDVQHIHWYVFDGGTIMEHWANRDDVGMMQQLGLLPETTFDLSKLLSPSPPA